LQHLLATQRGPSCDVTRCRRISTQNTRYKITQIRYSLHCLLGSSCVSACLSVHLSVYFQFSWNLICIFQKLPRKFNLNENLTRIIAKLHEGFFFLHLWQISLRLSPNYTNFMSHILYYAAWIKSDDNNAPLSQKPILVLEIYANYYLDILFFSRTLYDQIWLSTIWSFHLHETICCVPATTWKNFFM